MGIHALGTTFNSMEFCNCLFSKYLEQLALSLFIIVQAEVNIENLDIVIKYSYSYSTNTGFRNSHNHQGAFTPPGGNSSKGAIQVGILLLSHVVLYRSFRTVL